VVQTIHNYRMGCLNGLHLRAGSICERCRPGQHLAGMALGCYRGSRAQSLVFGLAQTISSWRGAWRQPALFVTPSAFLREKLMAWGIPADKIEIKPHFIPGQPQPIATEGDYALFVGRLAAEKGLDLLLDVWHPERLPLIIAGDGPLRGHLEQRVRQERKTNVQVVGYQERAAVNRLLQRARFLVMPSLWFETFGLVVIEAYAHGVPVIATRIGALADLVQDGVTGFLFAPHDRADLGAKLTTLAHDRGRRATMSSAARREYERAYSAESQAQRLAMIYTRAMARPTAPKRR
jgi:glycosyltransferase involved in cell wall biosynthesis